jgi:hypothetical protein
LPSGPTHSTAHATPPCPGQQKQPLALSAAGFTRKLVGKIPVKIEFLTLLPPGITMLAKRTSKNQITLPKAIVQVVGEADYYDVTIQNGKIVLTPVRLQQADAVRAKLEELGITQDDVGEAIAWARKHT